MKKILIVAVLALTAVTSLWAQTPSFMFSVGATLSRLDHEPDSEAFSPISNGIAVGGEIRIMYHHIKLGATGEATVVSSKELYFSGLFDVGLMFDIKDMVGIMVAIGPSIDYVFSDRSVPEEDRQLIDEGFFYALIHGPFHYRLNLEAIVGPVLRVGFAYTFPTQFTLDELNMGELNPFKEGNIDSGRLSFCLQMRIF